MRRRDLLALAGGLLAGSLPGLAGCTALRPGTPDATPVPFVPFTEVTVIESGGVDGRLNLLTIGTDGTGLLMGREPAAGRLADTELERLRTLLESEQFRGEVATRPSPEPPQCSDQVTVAVQMGPLMISRTGPCRSGDDRPTPVLDEILTIVAAPLAGTFDGPVRPGEPTLVPLRLEARASSGQAAYLITVDRDGVGTLTRDNARSVRRTLTAQTVDPLRLLLARLKAVNPSACAKPGRYRLVLIDGPPVTVAECDAYAWPPELRSVVNLLETALGA